MPLPPLAAPRRCSILGGASRPSGTILPPSSWEAVASPPVVFLLQVLYLATVPAQGWQSEAFCFCSRYNFIINHIKGGSEVFKARRDHYCNLVWKISSTVFLGFVKKKNGICFPLPLGLKV